jgi:hypothetical protein
MRSTILRDERAWLLITAQWNTERETGLLAGGTHARETLSPAARPAGWAAHGLLAQLVEQLPCKEKVSRFDSGAVHEHDSGWWRSRQRACFGNTRSPVRARPVRPGLSVTSGSLAHRVERLPEKQQVRGSSPRGTTAPYWSNG